MNASTADTVAIVDLFLFGGEGLRLSPSIRDDVLTPDSLYIQSFSRILEFCLLSVEVTPIEVVERD